MQNRQLPATWLAAVQFLNDSRDDPNCDSSRCCAAIDKARGQLLHRFVPFAARGPVQRLVGIGKVRGALRQGERVQPVGIGQGLAQANPVKPVVQIAGIGDCRDARRIDDPAAHVRAIAGLPDTVTCTPVRPSLEDVFVIATRRAEP